MCSPRTTASAGQGNKPTRRGKAQDLAQFVVPANQLGNRLRQVRWRQDRSGLRCRERRAGALVRARRQNADLAGELVTPPGDRVDQLALHPESGAQCRNLGVQIFLLDDPIGPHARHQRVLADDLTARVYQRH
jgi:hypothetical protein